MFYIIGAYLVQYIPERFAKRLVMMTACAVLGVSLFTVGPSKLLHFPNSLPIMILGQALIGIVIPFCFI